MASLYSLCSTIKKTINPQEYLSIKFKHYSIPDFDEGKPTVVYGQELKSNKLLISYPCILFSRLNPRIRRVWDLSKLTTDYQAIASTEFVPFIIKDESKLNSRYLFWFLHTTKFLAFARAGVVAATKSRERVKKENLFDVDIPLPPLDEQKRIAEILDRADAIRQKRERAIALTEELARSTFLEMFGDPITNPRGWEVDKISNFGQVITGNTPPRSNPQNYGDQIEWVKSDNITTPYHFLTEASEKLSKQGKQKARVLPPESILVTCIAGSKSSIGKAAITDREVAFNQQINAIIPNSNIDPYFLYTHFLVCPNLVQAKSTDSMKGLVSKSKFCEITFLNPPYEKQSEFGKWFLKYYKWTQNLRNHAKLSDDLFNSLLQRAFKGEL